MTILQRRFATLVRRFGETFAVGATPGVGIFVDATYNQAGVYLTSAELGAAARPIRLACVDSQDATASGATVAWNSLTLTVKKVVDVRFQGTTVAKLLVLA